MNEITRQLLGGVVEEEVLLGYCFFMFYRSLMQSFRRFISLTVSLKADSKWLWGHLWSWRFAGSIWRPAESYQVYIFAVNQVSAVLNHKLATLFNMAPPLMAEYWKTTIGSRRKAMRPSLRVCSWKWTTFKTRTASCKTFSRRRVISMRIFAKKYPDSAARTQWVFWLIPCLSFVREMRSSMYSECVFALFDVIHRSYQSWHCRFQSCRDKNMNWKSM